MEWVEEFYDKQEKWTRCYTGPITEHHTDRVGQVEKVAGPAPKKILELGSGGGQFAVAASSRGHKVVAVELNNDFVEYVSTKGTVHLCHLRKPLIYQHLRETEVI